MGRLIDESLLQEKLALIPMEERTFRRTVEELENAPTVEAIPLERLEQMREEIEQAFCKVENNYDHGRNYGLYMAMQIINKAIKEADR